MVDAAVKREFDAFTSDPARVAKYRQDAMASGWFVALDQARMRGDVGPALFAHEYRRYYDMLLEPITTALRETQHIRKALHHMEMTANQGRHRRGVHGLSAAPDDAHFQESLRIFQAWLASLFEAYIRIFGYIEGTRGAARKVKEFGSDGLKLIDTLEKEGVLNSRHSELFQNLTEL